VTDKTANQRIGVGIVGANVEQGWAARAHIPALRSLDGFAITGVCTTRRESAERAAAELGGQPFIDAGELARAGGVDLVTVSVKVPEHAAAVIPALEAGKPVFCEWPLGRTTEEAERLAKLARSRGVLDVVGLQARGSPELQYVRDLIADGYVGKATSISVYCATPHWSDVVGNRHMADASLGVTLLAIPGGHTLDALSMILGDDLEQVQAIVEGKRTRARLAATGESLPLATPDHVAVLGRYAGGAILSAQFLGGSRRPSQTAIFIDGEDGSLTLEMEGLVQSGLIRIAGVRGGGGAPEILAPPRADAPAPHAPAGPPFNVAQMYVRLAGELGGAQRTLPDFDHAVRLHRLLDAISAAAASGRKVEVPSR